MTLARSIIRRDSLSTVFLAIAAAALLPAPLGGQCNPDGGWQSADTAPPLPGIPIGPSDVLGVPALLFAGAVPGSAAPFFLWDGTAVVPLAAGPDRTIHLASGAIPYESPSGPVIAVRGNFEIAGVSTVLAFWDGTDWQLPGVRVQGVLHALAVLPAAAGDELWIGGEVSFVGAVSFAGGVARYDASGWDEPAQVSGSVRSMAVELAPGGALLYLAGTFFAIDGAPVGGIASYDGTTWSSLSASTSGEIEVISVVGGELGAELWVAGDLAEIGGVPVDDLARRQSGVWEAVPPPGNPSSFVPTKFIVVPTEHGDRVAPVVVHPTLPSFYGYLGWDDAVGEWVGLADNPSGAVLIEGSSLVVDGIYRGSASSILLQRWCHGPEHPFGRGDANDDGAVDIADVIRLLDVMFHGVSMENCEARHDANADGLLNIADPVLLLHVLFPTVATYTIPPPTLPNCGLDSFPAGIFCLEPQGGC